MAEERVLVTEDTDFGAMPARNQSLRPSLVLFRSADPLTPEDQGRLLLANLDALAEELSADAPSKRPLTRHDSTRSWPLSAN